MKREIERGVVICHGGGILFSFLCSLVVRVGWVMICVVVEDTFTVVCSDVTGAWGLCSDVTVAWGEPGTGAWDWSLGSLGLGLGLEPGTGAWD